MTNRLLLSMMRLLSATAGGISLYLLFVSLTRAGMPAGCGKGSGCAEVMSSRWAGSFGMPVSLPAALVYFASLVLTWSVGTRRSHAQRRRAWRWLIALAVMIATA